MAARKIPRGCEKAIPRTRKKVPAHKVATLDEVKKAAMDAYHQGRQVGREEAERALGMDRQPGTFDGINKSTHRAWESQPAEEVGSLRGAMGSASPLHGIDAVVERIEAIRSGMVGSILTLRNTNDRLFGEIPPAGRAPAADLSGSTPVLQRLHEALTYLCDTVDYLDIEVKRTVAL